MRNFLEVISNEDKHYIFEIYWHLTKPFQIIKNLCYVMYLHYAQNFNLSEDYGEVRCLFSLLLLSHFLFWHAFYISISWRKIILSNPIGSILLSAACKYLFTPILLVYVLYLKAQLIVEVLLFFFDIQYFLSSVFSRNYFNIQPLRTPLLSSSPDYVT
jgi:hypothetical protein